MIKKKFLLPLDLPIEVKSHTNAFEYLEWNSGLYWMKRIQIPHSALLPQLTLTLTVRQRRRKVEIYSTSYHRFGSWEETLSITFMAGKDHLLKLVGFSHTLYTKGGRLMMCKIATSLTHMVCPIPMGHKAKLLTCYNYF